jgi:hypothetical protein
MPRLLAEVMGRVMFRTRQEDKSLRPPEDDALDQAGYGLHERGGQIGWMRSGNIYTKASEHPVRTALATAAAAGLAAGYFARCHRIAH